jgi:hypothetical protein
MTRKGRKPQGAGLVAHLDLSPLAKERLETIVETLAGQLTIGQACERLGVCKALFHRLRKEVLRVSGKRLEPRAVGRRPRKASPEALRCKELERQLEEMQAELKLALASAEVARVLPHPHDAALKKTTVMTKWPRS